MRRLLLLGFTFLLTCLSVAKMDDHIIQFVLKSGQHFSFKTNDIADIKFDFHNQDLIDSLYRDSIYKDSIYRDSIYRDSIYRDSLYRDSIYRDSVRTDSIGRLNTVGYKMEKMPEYSIFLAALKLTGLYDSLNVYSLQRGFFVEDRRDTNGDQLWYPTEKVNGYTVFAETDSVMKLNGITSINDLIVFANKTYGSSADAKDGWFDYYRNNNIVVSTGDDYTSRSNALNMFVSYHIVKAKMAYNELLFMNVTGVSVATTCWNYANNADQYDYYETMLPKTLIKIWKPFGQKHIWINRYRTLNTLTDEIGTMGSMDMHEVVRKGVLIEERDSVCYNGHIHSIGDMLVYDELVPDGVLNERMRFEATTLLPEMINNRMRYMYSKDVSELNGGGSGVKIGFPVNYFDNLKNFSGEIAPIRYNVKGYYNAYQADAMYTWGNYDYAVKLPPLPDGEYEIRVAHPPMAHGGSTSYSIAENPNALKWDTLRVIDNTVDERDPSIGWTPFYEEADMGIASDKEMREKGFMRGPYSYTSHPERGWDSQSMNCRGDNYGNIILRAILTTKKITQGDLWLRITIVPYTGTNPKSAFDFIEICPVGVCNNSQYMEDWY